MPAEERKNREIEKKPKGARADLRETKESKLMMAARDAEKEGLKGIVHLVGKDISGKTKLTSALRQVRGIGMRTAPVFSNIISQKLGIPSDIYIGKLTDEQIVEVEKIIQSPKEYGVPGWLLNRQKDLETGMDKHLVGNDLTFAMKQDIEREKELYTWRGYRHIYGKKVRGQHTRTSGRKGMTVGVARKAVLAARTSGPAAAGTAGTKKEEKK